MSPRDIPAPMRSVYVVPPEIEIVRTVVRNIPLPPMRPNTINPFNIQTEEGFWYAFEAARARRRAAAAPAPVMQ